MGLPYSAKPARSRLPGRQAFALTLFSLAFLAGLALCPASVGAQDVDGWLVGYNFECCPPATGQQEQQFLALAYVPRTQLPTSENKITYYKFQVFGHWRALVLATNQNRDNMQRAILGRPYASESRELLDFQRAVKAPDNGYWTEETWRAVYDYFKNLKAPQRKTIGSRTIAFVPLLKERLAPSLQQELKDAVENMIVGRNRIPPAALEPFLSLEDSAARQTWQQAVGKSTSTSLPGNETDPAVSGQQGAAGEPYSRSRVYELSPLALALVNSLEPNRREAVRQALAALPADRQATVVRLVEQAGNSENARRASERADALQKMLDREQARHQNLVEKLKQIPDDLKAQLKEAGVNPDNAFDFAKKQSLSHKIALAWNSIEDRKERIDKPLYITGLLTMLILILIFTGIRRQRAERAAKKRAS